MRTSGPDRPYVSPTRGLVCAHIHTLLDHLSHPLVLCECIPWGRVITTSEAGEIILGVYRFSREHFLSQLCSLLGIYYMMWFFLQRHH